MAHVSQCFSYCVVALPMSLSVSGGGYCKLYVSVYFFPSLARNNIDVDCLHVYHELSYIMASFHPRLSKHDALASRHGLNFTYFHPYLIRISCGWKIDFFSGRNLFYQTKKNFGLTKMKRREGKNFSIPSLRNFFLFRFRPQLIEFNKFLQSIW